MILDVEKTGCFADLPYFLGHPNLILLFAVAAYKRRDVDYGNLLKIESLELNLQHCYFINFIGRLIWTILAVGIGMNCSIVL